MLYNLYISFIDTCVSLNIAYIYLRAFEHIHILICAGLAFFLFLLLKLPVAVQELNEPALLRAKSIMRELCLWLFCCFGC